jgi:hypothetical protein
LKKLKDPRSASGRGYDLISVMSLMLAALMAGQASFDLFWQLPLRIS